MLVGSACLQFTITTSIAESSPPSHDGVSVHGVAVASCNCTHCVQIPAGRGEADFLRLCTVEPEFYINL